MGPERIGERVEQLRVLSVAPQEQHGAIHETAFKLYQDIEQVLQNPSNDADALIHAQTEIMRIAAQIPAQTARCALMKLALWRWDAPNLNDERESSARYDDLAYAAFVDFARILSERGVLKDTDPVGV